MEKYIRAVLVLILTVILSSCGSDNKETVEEKQIPIVKVKEITGETFTELYRILGVVKPYASAKLSSEEGGIITYLRKDKGDRVSRGEVVVRLLKDSDYAMYEQALAQYNLAKENYERLQRLYIEGAATEQQFVNAKLQLEVAEKSVDVYEVRLRKSTVVSPINGIIDVKYMNRGEMSSPGAPIVSIVDVSRVKVSAGIPERYVNDLSLGQSIDIIFSNSPDEKRKGIIRYISPTINAVTRTFEIEVVMGNPQGKLKPEMAAYLEITKLAVEDAVVLQQDEIVDNVEEQFVFILEGDVARKKIIHLGGRNGNDVIITDGLNIGDKFIYEGFQKLVDGDKVQVVN
ncbi:MAG: efflux RND transporter periplasmic adaptor subunit [Ignavibacteria bacterium]|nr:efflux RND transporter periplasmic adaptor subunit [Ignavibacteria bacterium]